MQLLIFVMLVNRQAFGLYWTLCFSLRSLVGSNGLGPSTSRLSGVCSNQLSYEPIMVEVIGFEPMTPCLQGRCSTSWAIPPLSFATPPSQNKCPLFLKRACLLKTNKKETIHFRSTKELDRSVNSWPIFFSLKGGDPAAPSDTATLLRLHPSHRYCLRQLPPCG